MLEGITIQLHSVSQQLNTGVSSAHMSINLSEKLLGAHVTFCERTGQGAPGTTVHRIHGMLRYVLASFRSQNDWLESYITRKDTAMGFVSILGLMGVLCV